MFLQLHHHKRSGSSGAILLNVRDISRIEKTEEGSSVHMTVTQTPIRILETYEDIMGLLKRAKLVLQGEPE
ncbi:MAG: hypothetical protein WBX25_15230 [Rhodomicrobium sp.]